MSRMTATDGQCHEPYRQRNEPLCGGTGLRGSLSQHQHSRATPGMGLPSRSGMIGG